MMYFIKTGDIYKALEYGEKAIFHQSVEASNYLGRLYWRGEFVESNKEKAFNYFLLGTNKNNLSSLRLTIEFLLSQNPTLNQEKYKAMQPYYEKAAIYGDECDAFELLSFYWNAKEYDKINQLCKSHKKLNILFADSWNDIANSGAKGWMRILKTEYKNDFNDWVLMYELPYKNHNFQLFKRKTGANTSDVSLVRDNKAIIYTEKCGWGFGECPTFDIWEKAGCLFLKISDFDHYGVKTMFTTISIFNPLSENIVSISNSSDLLKGRHDLKFSAYIS